VKITNLSLAATMAVGMMSVTNADVDVKVGGEGVLYYQTMDKGGDVDLFDKGGNSRANAGLQLNVSADLGNDFGLGYQETFLGTLGLEKNLVGNTMQTANQNTLNSHAMTKLYLTKKIVNTTLKLGKQELPKSLSPLAFSEGWNVFKNTFDAAVVINSDIPDTTLVGAYVSKGNGTGGNTVGLINLGQFNDLRATAGGKPVNIDRGAYMLTVKNQSIKQVPITLTYYTLNDINNGEAGSAVWADMQVDAGIPVKFGLQGGTIMPENGLDDTTAVGAKITGKAGPVNLTLAYSTVDDGTVAVKNIGTGIKTPLYTQIILNQNHIASDADTFLAKGVVPIGPGKVIAQYSATTDNSDAGTDYQELNVIYKFKALGTTMLAAYIMSDHDVNGQDPNNIIRLWTRYKF
jgi:hypothetical protein